MAVIIGNARISEHGTVNGTRGDQTGKEVMTQPWSSGGTWSYVIRPKSATVAKKIATAMSQACANNNIGYSQADRLSLNMLAVKNGYNLAKVGKCNCDCSSLVAVCCNAAGVKVQPTMYTGNELAVLKGTGKFTVYTSADYTKSDKKLHTGDILLRNGHTAIVTQGVNATPAPAKKTTPKKSVATIAQEVIDGKWGSGDTRKKKLKATGYDYATVQAKVNELLKAKPKKTAKKTAKKSYKQIAKEVIDGKWGNGLKRRAKLKKAGYSYKKVQAEVNKLLK